MKKKQYKLKVQIGKKPKAAGLKKRVYRFETDDPVEAITSINIPKMVEECFFTLEYKGKTATRSMNALRARRLFNSKLNSFYFVKTMKWMLK